MTTKARKFNVFQPLKKNDRARCAYLGLDGSCLVLFERKTDLGKQEYLKATTQVHNLHVTAYGNYFQDLDPSTVERKVHRVILHDSALGLLAIPLATGKRVNLEIWPNNGSQNTKEKGFVNQTLVIEVRGLGRFSVSEVPGLISNGFTLQGPNIEGGWGAAPEPITAEGVRAAIKEGQWGFNGERILASDDPVLVWHPRDHKEKLLFRPLTTAEVAEFTRHAVLQEPDLTKWDIYHPVCREEWVRLGKVRLDAAGDPIDPDEFKNADDKRQAWEETEDPGTLGGIVEALQKPLGRLDSRLEGFTPVDDRTPEHGSIFADPDSPERCSTTETSPDGRSERRCTRYAGHAPGHHFGGWCLRETDPTFRQVGHATDCRSRTGGDCNCGIAAPEGRL